MECEDKVYKCIVIDANVSNFIDFNGWPNEVVIFEVRGLEKAFGVTCMLFDPFDPANTLSVADMIKVFEERHLDYREV